MQGASSMRPCETRMAPPAGRVGMAELICLRACSTLGRQAVAATCTEGSAAR